MNKTMLHKAIVVPVLVLFLALLESWLPCKAQGDGDTVALTVGSYCQLIIDSADLEVEKLNKLISLVGQYADDEETFLAQEDLVRQNYDSRTDALFRSYGTTAEKYIAFGSRNKRVVDAYLKSHPDVKNAIDAATDQVGSLLDQYETLRQDIVVPAED